MTIETVRPTSNVDAVWSSNAYTLIDDAGGEQPDIDWFDAEADVQAIEDDDFSTQTWGMGNITVAGDADYEVSAITVWGYWAQDEEGTITADPSLRIKVNGVWSEFREFAAVTAFQWFSETFTDLSANAGDYELHVEGTAGENSLPGDGLRLRALYAEVTYVSLIEPGPEFPAAYLVNRLRHQTYYTA